MPTTLTFACDLRHGLHARPASLIAQIAEKSGSRVTVRKTGAGEADGRSVLSVIALDIQPGNAWEIAIEGEDEALVAEQLTALVTSRFGEDEGASLIELPPARVPAALKRMNAQVVSGVPASRGVGRGTLLFVRARGVRAGDRRPQGLDAERARLNRAMGIAADEIEKRIQRSDGTAADLLAAHRTMLDDSQLRALIDAKIEGGMSAENAVAHAAEVFGERLRAAASALIRERAADVQDLAVQVLDAMGVKCTDDAPALTEPSILVSESLTPGQLLNMDASKIAGLVLGEVGLMSHVIILARSMGVPAIVGAPESFLRSRNGGPALIDGTFGFVAPNPPEALGRLYGFHERARAKREEFLASFGKAHGRTSDGVRFEVGANASSAAEVARAITGGADGIGLFRTEFLYLGRTHAPTEEELVRVFSEVVANAAGRPVIFRTFDIGADKPAPFLHQAAEANPFLGARGARLYQRHATLLRTQLRSIVRAAAGGNVRIMAPMITSPQEMKWFREQVRAVEANLVNGGFASEPLPVGMMLETPAAAASVRAFCAHADFFSLGTNDLSQYWFAADRGNAAVAPIVDELDASFVELIRGAVAAAKNAGKWIGMCGEMASDAAFLPVLVALGLDEISIAGASGAEMKYRVSKLEAGGLRSTLDGALKEGADVRERFTSIRGAEAVAPIADELIRLECEAATKEEAIREMVGVLWGAGRTDAPWEVEEAVWAREETYSTGLGFGFAVPHCRSKAVEEVSIAVGRLKSVVDWGSNDGLPVRHVLLLAVPESVDAKAHLQVLGRLARKLVHEEFRGAVERCETAESLRQLLKAELAV